MAEANWFSPPWEDVDDDAPAKPSLGKAQKGAQEGRFSITTVSKLIKAHSVLDRLDTIIAEAPPLVAKGTLARIALSEASGFLAHHKARISPRDLALRAAGITGSYTVALESGRLAEELIWSGGDMDGSDLPDDWDVSAAIAFARHIKRLPQRKSLLHKSDRLFACLSEMGVRVGDRDKFEIWLAAMPGQHERPGLLLACWIAAFGLPDRQREDKLDLGALFVAAAKMAEVGTLPHVPFMLWSAPTSWLDRLGTQGGEEFDHRFLDCAAEAATAGLREARRTMEAADKIPGLDARAGSKVTEAAWVAITEPVLTVGALAAHLALTTRATSTIINRLVDTGFLIEVTRRDAWRAYSIA